MPLPLALPNRRRSNPLLALAVIVLCSACASLRRPSDVPASYAPAEIPAALGKAQTELDTGKLRHAFFRARSAARSQGLSPDDKLAAQALFDRASEAWINAHSEPGTDPDLLEELLDLDVTTPLAVRAGVQAATLHFANGERMKAFRLLQRVDRTFPHHQERVAAGGLLAQIGFSFAEDPRRYGLIFHYRDNAPQVLEYLVLEYPSQRECDRAYLTLADLYVADQELELAIERLEDLVLWHSESPLVPAARARIPHLRLLASTSPEYDRTAFERARQETEEWLATYDDAEWIDRVRSDRLDALRRLADSDLSIAKFYERVGNSYGAERHARRAVDQAREGGDPDQVREAESYLGRIAQPPAQGGP